MLVSSLYLNCCLRLTVVLRGFWASWGKRQVSRSLLLPDMGVRGAEQAWDTHRKGSSEHQRNNPNVGPGGGKELGVRKGAWERAAQERPVCGAKIVHPV